MKLDNIIYDTKILDGEKASVHEKNLMIADLNLKDFNSRSKKDVSIKYNENDFKFSLVKFELNDDIADSINFYISWFRNKEHDNSTYQQTFLNQIKSEYDEITQEFRTKKVFSTLTQQDILRFKSKKEEFVSKYHNFYPKGVLSEKQEKELSSILEKEFITPIQTEI